MSAPMDSDRSASIRSFYDRALGLMKAEDLEAAEHTLRRAVAIYARDPNILCLLGELQLRQGWPQQSRNWFQRVLELFPGYPRALEGVGKSLLAEKKPKRAADYLRRAAAALPNRVSTHLALGRALAMSGQAAEADTAISRALELDPDRSLVVTAAEVLSEGQVREAEDMLRRHLAKKPGDALALRLLARIAMDAGHRGAAIRLLERCVRHAPDFILAHNDLADLYMKEDRFDDALASVDRALALDGELAHSWVFRGNVLARSQQHSEAIGAYDQALAFSPGHHGAMAGKGHVLKTIGRTAEAIAVFRECIRAHPGFGEPWWSLANLKTFSFDPGEVEVLEDLIKREEPGEEARVNMHYALAKHHENQGHYDTAMAHYDAGARLRRAQETYDPVQNQVFTDRAIEVFSREFFAERADWGLDDEAPILVVGLPRSGSTLIEQILASHSQVDATHELGDLARCARATSRVQKDRVEYPKAALRLAAGEVQELGRRYLKGAAHYRGDAPFFIDKMPNNFQHLGLLHLMLPKARIIDARRHPLDSCLGSYKQLFYRGQSFTYDWFDLGEYYLQYRRIMAHWQSLFPERILEVNYEDLVRDQEGQTRRMLDFLALDFEPGCLRFWETERAINTASSEQVRRPIYTKGLDFWKHYESHLDELIHSLEPLLKDLPEEHRPRMLR